MIAVCGIGNPGAQYEGTRHNVGFMVVDKLAEELDMQWESKSSLKADIAKDNEYILFKPQTFVNLSGEAAGEVTNFYKVESENLWVVADDADLPLGKINIKFAGSDAGHNGIKSIDGLLGANYWRVRIGIGKDEKGSLADHVLSRFTPEQQVDLTSVIDQTVNLLVQSLKDKQIISQTINGTTKNN